MFVKMLPDSAPKGQDSHRSIRQKTHNLFKKVSSFAAPIRTIPQNMKL